MHTLHHLFQMPWLEYIQLFVTHVITVNQQLYLNAKYMPWIVVPKVYMNPWLFISSTKQHIYVITLITKIILFIRHLDRICTLCSFHANDITLTAQMSFHYVYYKFTNWHHKTNFTYMYSQKKETMLVCLGLVYTACSSISYAKSKKLNHIPFLFYFSTSCQLHKDVYFKFCIQV